MRLKDYIVARDIQVAWNRLLGHRCDCVSVKFVNILSDRRITFIFLSFSKVYCLVMIAFVVSPLSEGGFTCDVPTSKIHGKTVRRVQCVFSQGASPTGPGSGVRICLIRIMTFKGVKHGPLATDNFISYFGSCCIGNITEKGDTKK